MLHRLWVLGVPFLEEGVKMALPLPQTQPCPACPMWESPLTFVCAQASSSTPHPKATDLWLLLGAWASPRSPTTPPGRLSHRWPCGLG